MTRHVPYALAFTGGFLLEIQDRLLMRARPPRITRYGAWLLGRHLEYSTEKARARLGWQPAIGYAESIERTLQWFQDQEAGLRAGHRFSERRSAVPHPTVYDKGEGARVFRAISPRPYPPIFHAFQKGTLERPGAFEGGVPGGLAEGWELAVLSTESTHLNPTWAKRFS